MPHRNVKAGGKITDVFGHRFVLKTDKGKVLADIGPEAADRVRLALNSAVELEGEQKPTEIKVHRISIDGAAYVEADGGPKHKKDHGHHEPDLTPAGARRIAEKEGFKIVGDLSPHKKHYEANAEHEGSRCEIHVHADHIMKKYRVR